MRDYASLCLALLLGVFSLGPAQAGYVGPEPLYRSSLGAPLNKAEIYEVQLRLALLGYDVGKPDGVAGRKTRDGLRAFAASTGQPEADQRVVLWRLRDATQVKGQQMAACVPGFYQATSLNTHKLALRTWGDPIDPKLVEDNPEANYAELICRNDEQVDRLVQYRRGKAERVTRYTYHDCCKGPLQIQDVDNNGEITATNHIGREPDGSLTLAMSLDSDGTPNRLVVITPTDDGTRWTVLDMDGQVLARQFNSYGDDGLITGSVLYRGSDDRNKYVYHYERGSLTSNAFDRYHDGKMIQEARQKRDAFGDVQEERIRLAKGTDGTYYNRFYERGELVLEEKDDGAGNVFRYERENRPEGGLLRTKMYVNDRLVAKLEVVYDGDQARETRLFTPDGALHTVYPQRAVYFVGRNGEPRNGGPYETRMNKTLW